MDLTLWKDKLDAYLDPQEGDMLRLLERIVNMDSFTTDAQDVDQLVQVGKRPLTTNRGCTPADGSAD